MEKLKYKAMEITEADRQKVVTIEKEKFTIIAPTSKDKKIMFRNVANQLGGVPADAYPPEGKYLIERDISLSLWVSSGPVWWDGPDSCMSDLLKDELFRAVLDWDAEFQTLLKKNKVGTRVQEGSVPE